MSQSEHDIQNLIRLELSNRGYLCFRINVGKVQMLNGRWFSTGAPKGFSDLFGFRPDGQIFFIEVKHATGKVRKEQEKFIELVKSKGAIAGIARTADEAVELIETGTNKSTKKIFENINQKNGTEEIK